MRRISRLVRSLRSGFSKRVGNSNGKESLNVKPHVNVVQSATVDTVNDINRASLLTTKTPVATSIDQIDNAPEERERGITIATMREHDHNSPLRAR